MDKSTRKETESRKGESNMEAVSKRYNTPIKPFSRRREVYTSSPSPDEIRIALHESTARAKKDRKYANSLLHGTGMFDKEGRLLERFKQ